MRGGPGMRIEKSPSGRMTDGRVASIAMEARTHPIDQGGHFLEFHT